MTRCYPLKSMSHSPVGKPVAIVGNWQVLLAPVANWLGRRSNAMADDFVDRLARRAGIKKVVHCTYRIPAFQNAKPEYAAVNLPRPFKQQIPRARCLLATARWREAVSTATGTARDRPDPGTHSCGCRDPSLRRATDCLVTELLHCGYWRGRCRHASVGARTRSNRCELSTMKSAPRWVCTYTV
jgi:hypothetical protein